MKLVVAVHVEGAQAVAAAVAFEAWDASEATKTYLSHIAHVENARGNARGVERLQRVELFAGAEIFDRRARD